MKTTNNNYLQQRAWKTVELNLESASPTGSLTAGGDGQIDFAGHTWTLRNSANVDSISFSTGSGLTFDMSADSNTSDGDAMDAPYLFTPLSSFIGQDLGKDDTIVLIAEMDTNADAATEACGIGFWDETTRATETFGFGAMLGHVGLTAGLLLYRWRAFGNTNNFFSEAAAANVVGLCLKRESCDIRYGNAADGVLPNWEDMTSLGVFAQSNVPAAGDDESLIAPQMLSENMNLILTAQTGNTNGNFVAHIRQLKLSWQTFSSVN
jgi:hypothetical protein